jgi:hypothetical protein
MLPLNTGKQLPAHAVNQPTEEKTSSTLQQLPESACRTRLVRSHTHRHYTQEDYKCHIGQQEKRDGDLQKKGCIEAWKRDRKNRVSAETEDGKLMKG